MARNTQLKPVPSFDNIVKADGKNSDTWIKWFNDIKFYLTNDSHQEITGAQGINVDAKYVRLINTSGGTYAVTLDAPTLEGKDMLIEMVTGSGVNTVTLALTNCTGGTASTTCTWNNSNQQLLLKSCYNKWLVVKQNGVTLT